MMCAQEFLEAARVPSSLEPQEFGLWMIERRTASNRIMAQLIGWPTQTVLKHATMGTLHMGGEIVMEDSEPELRKHLPIWMIATGRILITGLGLGCVVRGLLANPAVTHIDVVEIDRNIIRVIGAEFSGNDRVSIHHADAMKWDLPGEWWDYAWHDLWVDGTHLQRLHAQLFMKFRSRVKRQGAWAFPRWCARLMAEKPLGAPGYMREAA